MASGFQGRVEPDRRGFTVATGIEKRKGTAFRGKRDPETYRTSFSIGRSSGKQPGSGFAAPDAKSA